MKIRTFSELEKLKSFAERYEYLRLVGAVGIATFGFERYVNQGLYSSRQWKRVRDLVIIRDNGCDLGVPGYEIFGPITVHHMNPISLEDIESGSEDVFNLDCLISTSHRTHLAIHYGDSSMLPEVPIKRYPSDTSPWLQKD